MNKLVGFLRQWRGITAIITLFSLFSSVFQPFFHLLVRITSVKKLTLILRFWQEYSKERDKKEDKKTSLIHSFDSVRVEPIHWCSFMKGKKTVVFFSLLFHWDQFNKTTTTPYYWLFYIE